MPTVAPLDIEGHVVSTHFLGDIPLFATAAGTIHRLDGGEKVTEAHDGLLTCVRDSYSATLLSGGEDGRVLRIGHDGSIGEIANVPRKWVGVVAGGPQKAVAYGVGKSSFVRLSDGTVFGIIASTTAPFCADCDRSRLTADGMWYLCLYALDGIDLRAPLRAGASTEELAALITIMLLGICLISRISSEVRIDLPSGVMPGRLRGRDPVASITFLVSTRVSPASFFTITARGPSSRPWPLKSVILFFLKR